MTIVVAYLYRTIDEEIQGCEVLAIVGRIEGFAQATIAGDDRTIIVGVINRINTFRDDDLIVCFFRNKPERHEFGIGEEFEHDSGFIGIRIILDSDALLSVDGAVDRTDLFVVLEVRFIHFGGHIDMILYPILANESAGERDILLCIYGDTSFAFLDSDDIIVVSGGIPLGDIGRIAATNIVDKVVVFA